MHFCVFGIPGYFTMIPSDNVEATDHKYSISAGLIGAAEYILLILRTKLAGKNQHLRKANISEVGSLCSVKFMGCNMYRKKTHRWTEWPRGQSEYKHNNNIVVNNAQNHIPISLL